MTRTDAYVVAVIGGLTVVIALLAAAVLAAGVYLGYARLYEWREARRERRRALATCRAIDALGTRTPDHPTH
ncbi:hypothetical protein ACIQ9J_21750 [Streptomyces sp. NPDC094153]|uniref:hypothetical protein n=1 Tax=Streptomyces sp. NPDC094153 TaxID=3366058 RepID=UPI00382A9147